MSVRDRLAELDIELPRPWELPPGVPDAFDMVVVSRGQAWLAGHGPVDGTDILVQGVVGDDLTVEEGADAARLAGLSMLASLERAVGDSTGSRAGFEQRCTSTARPGCRDLR